MCKKNKSRRETKITKKSMNKSSIKDKNQIKKMEKIKVNLITFKIIIEIQKIKRLNKKVERLY